MFPQACVKNFVDTPVDTPPQADTPQADTFPPRVDTPLPNQMATAA